MRGEGCGARDKKIPGRAKIPLRAAGFTPAVFEPSVLRARKTVGVKPTAREKTLGKLLAC